MSPPAAPRRRKRIVSSGHCQTVLLAPGCPARRLAVTPITSTLVYDPDLCNLASQQDSKKLIGNFPHFFFGECKQAGQLFVPTSPFDPIHDHGIAANYSHVDLNGHALIMPWIVRMDGIRILYHTSRLYHQIHPLPRVGAHWQTRGVNG